MRCTETWCGSAMRLVQPPRMSAAVVSITTAEVRVAVLGWLALITQYRSTGHTISIACITQQICAKSRAPPGGREGCQDLSETRHLRSSSSFAYSTFVCFENLASSLDCNRFRSVFTRPSLVSGRHFRAHIGPSPSLARRVALALAAAALTCNVCVRRNN